MFINKSIINCIYFDFIYMSTKIKKWERQSVLDFNSVVNFYLKTNCTMLILTELFITIKKGGKKNEKNRTCI